MRNCNSTENIISMVTAFVYGLAFLRLCFVVLSNFRVLLIHHKCVAMYYYDFLSSVLRPFQDYFSSYETYQSVGGRKREKTVKKLAHPQTELGLSHMQPVRGSNPHQTQR